MTSFQSSLGEDEGIAEELAESQREISIAEFFEKNKHMLGFDSGARGLVTAVKEAVDNALDATEEAGILPDIYVEITEVGDYYRLVIEDNGPGITKEQLPKVFGKLLYGSRFHKREQNRGQQGIGISAAVLYSQLTSGQPAKITSRPKGQSDAQYFELIIDTDTNEPEISVDETTSWDRPHGTRIELEMEANMRARQQLHDYIKHTAVVNPHARIELREPGLDEPWKFERATDELPAETSEIRPHPHGVELGALIKMLEATESYSLSGFLQEEFTRVGKKTADSVIDAFRDRYYGRELAWSPPSARSTLADSAAAADDVETAIEAAVANKGAAATAAFAEGVAETVGNHDHLTRSELVRIVGNVADGVEDDTGRTFGSTVRENAVDAAWGAILGVDGATDTDREGRDGDSDGEDGVEESDSVFVTDLYALVDEATSTRKDDETVRAMAEALARRVADLDGTACRITRDDLERLVADAAAFVAEQHDATFGETARENVVEAVWA
ncbi:DNA topoisomerase VI subunit B, partial [Halorubrum tibetense]